MLARRGLFDGRGYYGDPGHGNWSIIRSTIAKTGWHPPSPHISMAPLMPPNGRTSLRLRNQRVYEPHGRRTSQAGSFPAESRWWSTRPGPDPRNDDAARPDRALARLKPYALNAKTRDADQVAKSAASMAEFGWTVPSLVAADGDGELIARHGSILAAAQLGLKEVPVIVLGHLTEALRRAYRIGNNRLTGLGGRDEALLLEELRGLLAEGFDLALIGIPEDELDALLADANDRPAISDDDDAIPEPPTEPITKLGDIWVLGMRRCDRPRCRGQADAGRARHADVHLAALCPAARIRRGQGDQRRYFVPCPHCEHRQ